LRSIASTSAFYQDYKNKDLHEFPIMERSTFKTHEQQILTNHHGSCIIQHTSGSTSNPVRLFITKEMLLAKRTSHQKMLNWYGLERESPELKLGGVRVSFYTLLYYYLKNKRYFNSFQIKAEYMDHIVTTHNRFKPAILYGYPSAIYHFIQFAEHHGNQLYEPRIIVPHAENLDSEITEKLKMTFPSAKIVNQYWSTEANIAETCPHGHLHIDEDTVICEVVNKNESGSGDLLITNLYSFKQPIIRYKIGDRIRLSEKDCTCGRKTRVIEHIEGREIDSLILPDNRVIPVTALYLARFAGNIMAYQLVYCKNQKKIEFRFIPVNENKAIDEQGIVDYFRKDFGLSVIFKKCKNITLTSGGKFRKLITIENLDTQ
jgi:phenylacetate-CoA ligase